MTVGQTVGVIVNLLFLLPKNLYFPYVTSLSAWVLWVFIGNELLSLVFIIALFKWRKWGFWGLCATSIVVFIVNIISKNSGIAYWVLGLSSVILLFAILNIGKENKGWRQLD